MVFQVSLHKLVRKSHQPKLPLVRSYVKHSLVKQFNIVNVDVSIVPLRVSEELNLKYRGLNYPTNVISLEDKCTREQFNLLQGSLILCDEIIVKESTIVSIEAHYVHMIVHGMLHLQGFDHIKDDEADQMEQLEIQILKGLGFNNPYDVS